MSLSKPLTFNGKSYDSVDDLAADWNELRNNDIPVSKPRKSQRPLEWPHCSRTVQQMHRVLTKDRIFLGTQVEFRAAASRTCKLLNAYIRGRMFPHRSPTDQRCTAIFEEVAKIPGVADSVLFCWRVWATNLKAPLAPDLVWSGATFGSTSHAAMAEWLRVRGYSRTEQFSIRRSVLPEIRPQKSAGRDQDDNVFETPDWEECLRAARRDVR